MSQGLWRSWILAIIWAPRARHYVVIAKSYRGGRQSNASDASDKELAEAVKDVHVQSGKTDVGQLRRWNMDNFVVGIATEANGKTILGPDEVAVLTDLGALLCGLYTYWIEKEGGDFLEDEY